MTFNGTGTFNRIYNWVTDKTNSVPIIASRMDTEMDGMATGLSSCITKDGQTTVTANIPMASHKFTGLSVGNARNDSITCGQVQDGQFTALGLTGGSADAYTTTPTPAITAYVASMEYSVKIHATNLTTTPTLLISGISGGTIKKLDASKAEIAVEASDMLANGWYNFKRNVANDAWILLNPEKAYYNLTNSTKSTTSTYGISYLNSPVTIANNGSDANNDIDFSAGVFQFSDGSGQAVASALTKRLDDAWAAGTNQGGLFSGSKANSTWYHCFAIYNPTTGVSDAGFDTSVTAANIPSGYTKYKRVGSIRTDGSGNILSFTQSGNRFELTTPLRDIASNNPGTSAVLFTLTIPLGIKTIPLTQYTYIQSGASINNYGLITSPSQTDSTPSGSIFSYLTASGAPIAFSNQQVTSNTSSQIRHRLSGSDGSTNLYFTTFGWIDYQL